MAVNAVTIDSVPLAPTDYRVDDQKLLVRIDGNTWPCCNNLGATGPGVVGAEIVVNADVGRPVPLPLQAAALELACELKRACGGASNCSVPDNVTGLVRRGVQMETIAQSAWLKEGMTGNPIIDMALQVYAKPPGGTLVDPAEVRRCRAKRVGT